MAVTRLPPDDDDDDAVAAVAVGVEFNLPPSSGESEIWTHHNP
jgi:hypothetical protein